MAVCLLLRFCLGQSPHTSRFPPPPQSKRQKLKDSSASAYIGAGPLDGGEGSVGGSGSGAVVTSDGGKDVSSALRMLPAHGGGDICRQAHELYAVRRSAERFTPPPSTPGGPRAARGAV